MKVSHGIVCQFRANFVHRQLKWCARSSVELNSEHSFFSFGFKRPLTTIRNLPRTPKRFIKHDQAHRKAVLTLSNFKPLISWAYTGGIKVSK
jgi:hypothetical protein